MKIMHGKPDYPKSGFTFHVGPCSHGERHQLRIDAAGWFLAIIWGHITDPSPSAYEKFRNSMREGSAGTVKVDPVDCSGFYPTAEDIAGFSGSVLAGHPHPWEVVKGRSDPNNCPDCGIHYTVLLLQGDHWSHCPRRNRPAPWEY